MWTFVATSAMTYEISRMRFYFAKHAFRIHKLSNLHISTQVTKHPIYTLKRSIFIVKVILEAFALSSLFLLILSYFSTITLFSNFPSLYSKINKVKHMIKSAYTILQININDQCSDQPIQ